MRGGVLRRSLPHERKAGAHGVGAAVVMEQALAVAGPVLDVQVGREAAAEHARGHGQVGLERTVAEGATRL